LGTDLKGRGNFWALIVRGMKKEETVKLISAEGFEFVVSKEAAMVSTIIRNMITSPGTDYK